MKTISDILALTVATGLACACSAPTNPTLQRLGEAAQNGKVLYGHQDDLMYGHTWNASEDGDTTFVRSDVKSVCGNYPAVLGLELGGIEVGDSCSLDGVNFRQLAMAAVKHHERGGIVTVSWHPRNIVTGSSAWDVSDTTVVGSILPGGAKHDEFIGWLSRVCDEIELMRDADGKVIPIVWRPWHEHSASWFWWGWNLCSADQYKALWKMTYDYMVRERGLRNLVWSISPDGGGVFERWDERYPGDEYVDIIGLDLYHFGWDQYGQPSSDYFIAHMRECLTNLSAFAAEHGKLLAVTETGCEGLKADKFFTGCLLPAIDGFPVCYLLTWRNASDPGKRDHHFYGPFPGSPNEADFCDFAANEKVVML